jgi:hypothetical protein
MELEPTQSEELEQSTQELDTQAPEQSGKGTQSVTDLSTMDKFMFEGREWTPAELKKSYMLHSDYTKKSQEMAEIREHWDRLPEYREKLEIDLRAVKANPALAEEFKKVYPKAFHGDLDKILQDRGEASNERGALPPEIQAKLDKIEKLEQFANSYEHEKFEQKVEAENMKLEKMEKAMVEKYKYADPSQVYAKVQALMDSEGLTGEDVTDKVWENAWKSEDDRLKERFNAIQNTNFNNQTKANEEGRDIGQGGSIPGEAPKKMKLDDVAEQMISDLKRQRG